MATKRKANRKRGRRRGSKRRNTAVVRQPAALAKYPAARRANPKRRRRHHKRRNPAVRSARRRNPLSSGIMGLKTNDIIGGAVGIVVDGVLQMVVPASWLGLLLRAGGNWAVCRYVLPKSISGAALLTSEASVAIAAANKAFNLQGLVAGGVGRFLPAAAGGGQQQTANGGQYVYA